MVATMIRGAQATGNVSASQHVRDVADRLVYLDPEASPFSLTLSKERAEKATNFKFEWAEKGGDFAGAGFAPKLTQVNNGAGYTAGDVSIVVDNGAYVNIGDTIKVVRTAEVLRVTNVVTNTLTVSRGVGSTAAAALVDNDDLFMIGPSIAEGASVGAANDFQEQWKFDYTQLYRHVASATETQQWVQNYIGQPRTRLRREKAVEHKIDLERSFLFGERNRDTTDTSAPINYTGGFLYWATANAKAAGGTLTEPEVWDWCEDLFAHTASGPTRTLFASALVCSVIDLLAGARLQTVPKDDTYGIAVKEWLTSHGRLLIVKHRLLETGAGASGYGGYGLAADMRQLKYRYGRNTQLLTDRQAPGDDKWVDEYLTECGLEFRLPAAHGVLSGVTG